MEALGSSKTLITSTKLHGLTFKDIAVSLLLYADGARLHFIYNIPFWQLDLFSSSDDVIKLNRLKNGKFVSVPN
jgi:hypothetical protein